MKGLRLDSHYEVLEKQIKALPEAYYTELVHYITFLIGSEPARRRPAEIENAIDYVLKE